MQIEIEVAGPEVCCQGKIVMKRTSKDDCNPACDADLFCIESTYKWGMCTMLKADCDLPDAIDEFVPEAETSGGVAIPGSDLCCESRSETSIVSDEATCSGECVHNDQEYCVHSAYTSGFMGQNTCVNTFLICDVSSIGKA